MDLETILLFLCALCLQRTLALYEDQAGAFDWHRRYVGPVSYISQEHSAKSSRAVIVASENGVLAAINPSSGKLLWRHVYEEGETGWIDAVLRSSVGSLLSLSGGGQLLRSWEMSTGVLKWELLLELPPETNKRNYPLNVSWRPGAALATLTGKNGGTVVIACGSQVASFSSRTGEKRWTYDLGESGVASFLSSDGQAVYLASVVEQSKLVMTTLNGSNGEEVNTQHLHSPWISSETTNCMLSATRVICLQLSRLDLYYADLRTKDSTFSLNMLPSETLQFASSLSSAPGDAHHVTLVPSSSPMTIWIKFNSAGVHHKIELGGEEETAVLVSELREGLPMVGWIDGERKSAVDVVLQSDNDRGSLTMELKGEGVEKIEGGLIAVGMKCGPPVYGDVKVFTKSDGSMGYSVATVMEDFTVIMLKQKGIVWHREEALGNIVAVDMLDLPASGSELIETFVELTQGESNPFKLASLRVQLQLQLAKEFIQGVQEMGVASLLQTDLTGAGMIRDEFNLRKMITTVSANGKLFGLDSHRGDVVWQSYIRGLESFPQGTRPRLHILRTTSHPPHPSLAVVVGGAKTSLCNGGSLLYAFNPMTGSGISPKPTCLPQILQTLLLPVHDHTHSRILLMFTKDLKVISYPSSPQVSTILSELSEQLYFFTADRDSQVMNGYRVVTTPPSKELPTAPVWTLRFAAESERIVSTILKSPNEHVNSQGRVKPDRSVQYKYLNPNLVTVVTESTDSSKSFVNIYLIDSITGGVVYHTTHKQASGPVHLVHSENWIVYQYHNTKQRRHEMVVAELYETHTNQSHSVWSSLYPPITPDVTSQAYAFPTTLHTITTTQTLQGITHKSILLGEHTGHIASIPKRFLDPRRSVEVTDVMKEEGIPPYLPAIDLKPVTFINYNQTVSRLRDIHTFPSGLESTCLVFATGLDLYFTRVMPSKQFDLLAVDFDYTLISAVVIGMAAATYILSRVAARKMLKSQWK